MTNFYVGNTIRNRRKELGITQENLAELSNLSVNYISRIERTEDQNISLKNLTSIASALKLTVTELLKNEHDTPSNQLKISIQERLLLENLRKLNLETQERLLNNFQDIIKTFTTQS